MANGASDSITPFFTIWTEPRATIRRIVDTDPTRNVFALAAIGPAISILESEWSKAMSNNANLSVLWPLWVVIYVVLAAALGIVSLYIGGAVWKWSGGLLGGVGSTVEVRAAIAWSSVPGIAGEIVLLMAILLGVPIPQATKGTLPQIDPAFYKFIAIELVLGLWGFVILLKTIGEVHRFSAWRALAAGLIPPLIALVAIGFAIFLFWALAGHH
ncbi:MAG: YIP1 family protein [Candidatus Binatus sp.]